jgi:hypothetical protein
MGCLSGIKGTHGCPLASSKSVKIIEECLLGCLLTAILTEVRAKNLVVKANAFLEEEARRPQVNPAPMKGKVRTLEAKIKKLVARVEDEPDKELCIAYDRRIKELQKEVNKLLAKIRDAERQNRKPVKPLSLDKAMTYLSTLRETLNQEIPVAAEAIRTLTGPIKIRQ